MFFFNLPKCYMCTCVLVYNMIGKFYILFFHALVYILTDTWVKSRHKNHFHHDVYVCSWLNVTRFRRRILATADHSAIFWIRLATHFAMSTSCTMHALDTRHARFPLTCRIWSTNTSWRSCMTCKRKIHFGCNVFPGNYVARCDIIKYENFYFVVCVACTVPVKYLNVFMI